jgi:hypothetical protein
VQGDSKNGEEKNSAGKKAKGQNPNRQADILLVLKARF